MAGTERYAHLQPGEALETETRFIIYEGLSEVSSVSPDGVVSGA